MPLQLLKAFYRVEAAPGPMAQVGVLFPTEALKARNHRGARVRSLGSFRAFSAPDPDDYFPGPLAQAITSRDFGAEFK